MVTVATVPSLRCFFVHPLQSGHGPAPCGAHGNGSTAVPKPPFRRWHTPPSPRVCEMVLPRRKYNIDHSNRQMGWRALSPRQALPRPICLRILPNSPEIRAAVEN